VEKVGIGLVGYGTVGSGVGRLLQESAGGFTIEHSRAVG